MTTQKQKDAIATVRHLVKIYSETDHPEDVKRRTALTTLLDMVETGEAKFEASLLVIADPEQKVWSRLPYARFAACSSDGHTEVKFNSSRDAAMWLVEEELKIAPQAQADFEAIQKEQSDAK